MTLPIQKHKCKTVFAKRCSARGVSHRNTRAGFTLIELLIVISIIAILASLGIAVIRSAEDDARASRTDTIITKINIVIQRRFEAFETRTLPFRVDSSLPLEERRQVRDQVLAKWILGEMPTTMDIVNFDTTQAPAPFRETAMVKRLKRHFPGSWSLENQDAECLYAILKNSWDGDNRGTHFLTPQEIGDTDGDQVLEVLDGWGDPIRFSITVNGVPVDSSNPGTLNDYDFEIRSNRDPPTIQELDES